MLLSSRKYSFSGSHSLFTYAGFPFSETSFHCCYCWCTLLSSLSTTTALYVCVCGVGVFSEGNINISNQPLTHPLTICLCVYATLCFQCLTCELFCRVFHVRVCMCACSIVCLFIFPVRTNRCCITGGLGGPDYQLLLM